MYVPISAPEAQVTLDRRSMLSASADTCMASR